MKTTNMPIITTSIVVDIIVLMNQRISEMLVGNRSHYISLSSPRPLRLPVAITRIQQKKLVEGWRAQNATTVYKGISTVPSDAMRTAKSDASIRLALNAEAPECRMGIASCASLSACRESTLER